MTKLPVTISFTGVTNLLGIIGIIGSLVFVGMELRQSQQIALAAQQQQRAALITEVIGTFSDANPPISLWMIRIIVLPLRPICIECG